jgi:hypothetical protein
MRELEVDLKWSLWSAECVTWEDYGYGEALRLMEEALGGGEPVTIHTAPRKEIRYGSVEVGEKIAFIQFRTEWDELHDLADTLGIAPADHEAMESLEMILPSNGNGEFGVLEEASLEGITSLEELLTRVDGVEKDLLEADAIAWTDLEEALGKGKTEETGEPPNPGLKEDGSEG